MSSPDSRSIPGRGSWGRAESPTTAPIFAGTSTYYVGFDNVQVGKLIGQGLMNCVADWKVANPSLRARRGEDTDPSAIWMAAGYNNVLWGTDLATPRLYLPAPQAAPDTRS